LDLKTGKLNWQFNGVTNFVETRPLVYQDQVYFGSWGNTFYALDKKTGSLKWKREKYTNRMLSPAAVWPVAANGKLFIVAPDRHMTALDAQTGSEIWDSGEYSCRESIGISGDGELVYIKNMTEGNVDAFYTQPDEQELAWECRAELEYEIAPSPITEQGNMVFVPTTNGVVCAIDKQTHQVAWKHKVSNALVNMILPIDESCILVTTLDGKVVRLSH
jgi:outer membrane protein assembly factor BamB